MSSVIHGLTVIVDRMMEDPSASRYQNMSTIYRAVHLHLPPYAVPGMHDGPSPLHPRLSPAYGGPSPHNQHDFNSPGAVAARGGEYGGAVNGTTHWDFAYGGNTPRDLTPQSSGSTGTSPVDYTHRPMSLSIIHGQDLGSPTHRRCLTAPSAVHFGGRHFRQGNAVCPREFDYNESDVRVRELDDCRRDFDSSGHADTGRPVGREGYLHQSPRLSVPPQRDFEYIRQPVRDSFSGRGTYANGGPQQAEFLPIQQQQQRLRQQQQQHLSRQSSDFSQDAVHLHEVHGTQHRLMHEDRGSSVHVGACGALSSPPHVDEMRRCHSSDTNGLSGMFEGMTLNSPNGTTGSSAVSAVKGLTQQGQTVSNGAGCVVQGELPVPDADVGIILGKGGATVRELQQLSGAKIMIARRNEFMPGTKHRLVTLAGAPLAVNMARFLIMRKIHTEKEKL